jgi:hypothetical protein
MGFLFQPLTPGVLRLTTKNLRYALDSMLYAASSKREWTFLFSDLRFAVGDYEDLTSQIAMSNAQSNRSQIVTGSDASLGMYIKFDVDYSHGSS